MADVPVLVLSGTVGVGKTSVLQEVSEVLVERGVPHVAVDVDALSHTYPRSAEDPFGEGVALENLAAVWANAARRGAGRAVLARVVEDAAGRDGFRTAIPGAAVAVVRLVAPPEVVAERLRDRERGAGREWHLRRAPELAAVLEASDVPGPVVTNDGDLRTTARAVLEAVGW